MADDITGKRLKKKVLERWENEGGRLAADPAGPEAVGPKSDHEGELNRPSGSHGDSTVGAPASPAEERKPDAK